MKNALIFAALVEIAAIVYAVWKYKRREERKSLFAPLTIVILGTMLSATILFHNLHYSVLFSETGNYPYFGDPAGPVGWFEALGVALHTMIRLFVVDCDFQIIVDAVDAAGASGLPTYIQNIYSLYALQLYILAPALTFLTVLTLLGDIYSEFRYRLSFNKRAVFYLFSEMNERSVALARSILEQIQDERPRIVFANVHRGEDGVDGVLLQEARMMRALCLGRDIAHQDILSKKENVEIFLIGCDETENVRKAALLTQKLDAAGSKRNIKLFAFASGKASEYTIDSLRYDGLLCYEAGTFEGAACFSDNGFKLRRVDYVRQLVWRTVPQMELLQRAHDGVISVMIAGMDAYGVEFFKMLVWYCQIEGYRLELNLFDAGSEMRARLHRLCPELIEEPERHTAGDADYSIAFFEGVDFQTDAFAELLQNSDRLRRTGVAIVALEDDDANIETAVYLRQLFDRKLRICAKASISLESEIPAIYAILHDDARSGVLQADNAEWLINHKQIPYHIRFIGSLRQQYAYDCVYDAKMEAAAYRYHIEWSEINQRASAEMKASGYTDAQIEQAGFAYSIADPQSEARKYERFEYFRRASIAKALHKQMLAQNGLLPECLESSDGGRQLCECANCIRRKRMEHNRWNAYMRAEGYSNDVLRDGEGRADRALKHNNLCNWDALDKWERAKD